MASLFGLALASLFGSVVAWVFGLALASLFGSVVAWVPGRIASVRFEHGRLLAVGSSTATARPVRGRFPSRRPVRYVRRSQA